MILPQKEIPVINIGRYRGMKIDQLPNSYLRWLVMQDFPKEWIDCAREKLAQSDFSDTYLSVSRHAVDMFSKRFLKDWVDEFAIDLHQKGVNQAVGLGTYIVNRAQEAWDKGKDISKHRHEKDGIIKVYKNIKWVFGVNPKYPDFKDVITVMEL